MKVAYTLKRSKRARALRITVYPDGAVVVTAPHSSARAAIERFVARHSLWARRKMDEARGKRVIRARRADIPRLKRAAALLARERCEHFTSLYGTSVGRIVIRAQRSLWGSCSHGGNLSFNYKIALLPPALADYVVAHEICHLLQFDHSKKFWEHVARTMPDHKRLRKELRDTVVVFD